MLDAFIKVVRSLNDHGAKYILVGGQAVAAHGYPRATHDIDFVVALSANNPALVIKGLQAVGYRSSVPVPAEQFCDPSSRSQWMQEKQALVFSMVSENPMEPTVDLFLAEPFEFEQEYSQVDRVELVEGVLVPLVTFETLLSMKRAAGRPRDLEDIRELELFKDKEESSRKPQPPN